MKVDDVYAWEDINELIEKLAALEHEQWMYWSKAIAKRVTDGNPVPAEVTVRMNEKVNSWEKLWIPYNQLSEEEKEHDRKWARKVLAIMNEE